MRLRDDGERLDLHQQLGQDQPGDLDRAAGRWARRVDERVAHPADGVQRGDVGDEVGQLDDVGEGRAGGGQATAQVLEDLPRLRLGVIAPDELPRLVEGDLPRDRYQPAAADDDVRVPVGRRDAGRRDVFYHLVTLSGRRRRAANRQVGAEHDLAVGDRFALEPGNRAVDGERGQVGGVLADGGQPQVGQPRHLAVVVADHRDVVRNGDSRPDEHIEQPDSAAVVVGQHRRGRRVGEPASGRGAVLFGWPTGDDPLRQATAAHGGPVAVAAIGRARPAGAVHVDDLAVTQLGEVVDRQPHTRRVLGPDYVYSSAAGPLPEHDDRQPLAQRRQPGLTHERPDEDGRRAAVVEQRVD